MKTSILKKKKTLKQVPNKYIFIQMNLTTQCIFIILISEPGKTNQVYQTVIIVIIKVHATLLFGMKY